MDSKLFSIQLLKAEKFIPKYSVEYYSLLLFNGDNCFMAGDTVYRSQGNTVLFLSPFQHFCWKGGPENEIQLVQFHGDFYCIEYHKREVACNGLLFNNIYLNPYIEVNEEIWNEIFSILHKINENNLCDAYSEAIVKTYLQLILALSSKVKAEQMKETGQTEDTNSELNNLRQLIENSFIRERNVSFYANYFSITASAFSKKIKKELGKTPTQLIQERVILEAKKRLHLTSKPVKEIASELNFEDEFYFSRYFKKNVGMSPLHYREKVGISVMAKLSMR